MIQSISTAQHSTAQHSTAQHSTAHANYVIKRIFCQPLIKAFSYICEEVFYVTSESEVK